MSAAVQDRPQPPETCQMFETPLIERFSRIHPATPFLFWLPVLGYVAYASLGAGAMGVPPFAGLVVLGALMWTFTEYTLHRFVFHYTGPRPWQRRMFFVLHGVHHDFPNDKDRLVMPLGASIPLGVVIYGLFFLLAGQLHGEPMFAGMALGYLGYDGTHYAVHHFKQSSRVGKFLRKHHMLHHHADHDGGFGVSTPLWDLVFGTMPQAKKRGQAAVTA